MQSFRLKVSLLLILLFNAAVFTASAQKKTAFLQVFGTIKSGLKKLGGVELKVTENGNVVQTVQSKDNGDFIVVMDLNRNYELVFSKTGYISKTILVTTSVPADAGDMGYPFKCNLELFEDVGGASKSASMNKPVAKIAYSSTFEEFDYDPVYTKKIQEEQAEALKEASDAKRNADQARLDSLNKLWGDSIARIKAQDAQLATERAAKDKARQDSITKANAANAAFATAQKAHADSLARADAEKKRLDELARSRAVADSLASAKAQRAALDKARQDSLLKAQANAKAQADSLAKASAEKKRLDELAGARDKARQDSISKAESTAAHLAEQARLKASADSALKAQARQKAQADSLAKAKADEDARNKALADAQAKSRADSLAKAKVAEDARNKALAEAAAKTRADSLAKAKADALEARKKFVSDSTAQATATQAREKSRQDSITRTEANARALAEARKKVVADSLARAEVEKQKQEMLAKAKAEQDAKAKVEEDRQKQLLADKARQDSVSAALKALKEKDDADKKAQVLADIQAKKDALAKANTYEKSETKAPATAVPKIKESDYSEGITDEKVSETNRNIERTVVKKDGVTYNYQKITYNWGGVFYFKNETSVTSTTFNTEINQARKGSK